MQEVVVVLDDGFNHLIVEGIGFLFQFFGDFFRDVFRAQSLVLPHDRLHLKQIDDAFELVFLSDGKLNGNGAGIEALADGVDGMLEIGSHLVHLVNEANARDFVFIGLAPHGFRLWLDAMHSVKHGASAVEHTQRALHFGGEVHVARSVNNIDTDVAPEAGGGGGRNGDASLLLLLHPVHRSCALMDLSDAVRLSGIEKDTLRRSGLTGIDVGHDADVPAPF